MSIRWDPLLSAALSRELGAALSGAAASGITMDGATRRVLLHTDRGTLALELHPRDGWVSLLPPSDPLPESRPLRARVGEVRPLPDESAFVVELPRAKRQEEDLDLVVELSGNRWNAVLVERESRAIRQVLVARAGGKRPLASGAPYEPPPTTGRVRPGTGAEWEALAEATDRDRRRATLLRRVVGVSSLNVDALLAPDGWERWNRLLDPATWGGFVIETAGGAQPYPVLLPGTGTGATSAGTGADRAGNDATGARDHATGADAGAAHPSLLDAFAAARSRTPDAIPTAALLLSPSLVEGLRDRARSARRKAEALRRQLATGADPGALRSIGDLLLARFSAVPRGEERVTLEGFDGARLEVELDPGLSPQENADRYYGEAARAAKVRRDLPGRIESAEREAARWERLLEEAMRGETTTDEAARAMGSGKRRGGAANAGDEASTGTGKRRTGPPRTLPYLRFTSSGGHEIRVGRSAARNDELTLKHSSPDDVWLHVRQSPGAHVVLRWNRKDNPPQRDLAEAAILAALNSEARHAGTVAVDWTRRKHVRKPRKAPPGSVVVERSQTIFVAPDPAVAERLAAKDDA